MSNGGIQGTLLALKVGLVFIIAMIILGFILFPRQYSIPSDESFKESDVRRRSIHQDIVTSKANDEISLRIKSSSETDKDRYLELERLKRRQKYKEAQSRSNGEEILQYRESQGLTPDGRKDKPKKSQSAIRAKAISNWVKKNVKKE